MHRIKENMDRRLEKCGEAPFHTPGPPTTGIAPIAPSARSARY
jgi:thiamine biosynthesis protein ThiC